MSIFFCFDITARSVVFSLSLHDALPIWPALVRPGLCARVYLRVRAPGFAGETWSAYPQINASTRSEEHTSELQSHSDFVCRLLLEKKNQNFSSDTRTVASPKIRA